MVLAVVTGGGSGIGEALSRKAASLGMCVALVDIDKENVDRVCRELKRKYAHTDLQFHSFICDVSTHANVLKLRGEIVKAFDARSIEYLFNNVGVGFSQPMLDMSENDLKKGTAITLFSAIVGTQVFLPLLLESTQKRVFVVNTASMAGLGQGDGFYSVLKHAVVVATETMNRELYGKGMSSKVGVFALCPGPVWTNINKSSMKIMNQAGKKITGGIMAYLPTEMDNDAVKAKEKALASENADNVREWIDNAISKELTAEITFDALEKNPFGVYIYTHPDLMEAMVKDRADAILNSSRNRYRRSKKAWAKKPDRSRRLNYQVKSLL